MHSVAISPDNTKIVSGSWDKTIKVWDLHTGKLLNTLEGHSSYVNSVAISPDNSKIVSGSYDTSIKVWDLHTGKLLNTLEGHSSPVECIASPDNTKIVSGSSYDSRKFVSGSAFFDTTTEKYVCLDRTAYILSSRK